MYVYDNISLNSSKNDKCLNKICIEYRHVFLFSNFFCEICFPCEITWKVVEPDRAQVAIKYGSCALHAG
jgi:hypothetical protein